MQLGTKVDRFVFIGLGTISLIAAIVPGGSDEGKRLLASSILFAGALVSLLYGFLSKERLSLQWVAVIPVLSAAGLMLGLLKERQFAGGEYWHFWRGFPYRWLEAAISISYSGPPGRWELFPMGFVVDALFWMNIAIVIVVAWHFISPRIRRHTKM